MSDARWHVATGSPVEPWARGLAWLWRLGPAADRPSPATVAFGSEVDLPRLRELAASEAIAAAVVAVDGPAPESQAVPARRSVEGVATFESGSRARGVFTIFGGGAAAVRSSLGVHAIREGRLLVLGLDPNATWGTLEGFWAYPAILELLSEVMTSPLALVPAVGCLRLDDFPGTAQRQLEGTAKGDARLRWRARRLLASYSRRGAVLNLAVAAEALDDNRTRVPLDRVWPRTMAVLREGVRKGTFEAVCHGLLHLDSAELEQGRVEFREFARLDADEARARLDTAIGWQREHLGEPSSFVAPAWTYGPAGREAARERGLPFWLRPEPGPQLADGAVHETLLGELPGLDGLDYSPLAVLAGCGLAPTVTFHGGLLDARFKHLRPPRDAFALARLALRRDIERAPGIAGVRWVGAGEYIRALELHGRVEVVGGEVRTPPGGSVVAVDRAGRRLAGAPS